MDKGWVVLIEVRVLTMIIMNGLKPPCLEKVVVMLK